MIGPRVYEKQDQKMETSRWDDREVMLHISPRMCNVFPENQKDYHEHAISAYYTAAVAPDPLLILS